MITESDIQKYIEEKIEESQNLDYKAADSLSRLDSKKKEISKDVSAMANSEGGIIIYGVKEYSDSLLKYLPEKIDPIDRQQFSKEWLEHVINDNIRPRISGITIKPVQLSSSTNHVVYYVEIPQSQTAHQAIDYRYYRRYNFESVPMLDYEIRDIMGRQLHPTISLDAEVVLTTNKEMITHLHNMFLPNKNKDDSFNLKLFAVNNGKRLANYVTAIIHIPIDLLNKKSHHYYDNIQIDNTKYIEVVCDNTVREIIGHSSRGEGIPGIPNYGPAHYKPLLPELRFFLSGISLSINYDTIDKSNLSVLWKIYADNAEVNTGALDVGTIPVYDKRE